MTFTVKTALALMIVLAGAVASLPAQHKLIHRLTSPVFLNSEDLKQLFVFWGGGGRGLSVRACVFVCKFPKYSSTLPAPTILSTFLIYTFTASANLNKFQF